jgi:NADPH:quinone reductase-like Zn-dependent oxidoreductase
VVPLLTDGKLRPVIERVVPLDRAEEAYGFVRSNSTFGKVVLSAQV